MTQADKIARLNRILDLVHNLMQEATALVTCTVIHDDDSDSDGDIGDDISTNVSDEQLPRKHGKVINNRGVKKAIMEMVQADSNKTPPKPTNVSYIYTMLGKKNFDKDAITTAINRLVSNRDLNRRIDSKDPNKIIDVLSLPPKLGQSRQE